MTLEQWANNPEAGWAFGTLVMFIVALWVTILMTYNSISMFIKWSIGEERTVDYIVPATTITLVWTIFAVLKFCMGVLAR